MDNAVHNNDIDKPGPVSFLTGLVFGTLAGLGAMMLFAPQSGKMTLTQIKGKSIELQNRAADTYDDLVTLTHFDNRKIETGTKELTENNYS